MKGKTPGARIENNGEAASGPLHVSHMQDKETHTHTHDQRSREGRGAIWLTFARLLDTDEHNYYDHCHNDPHD